MTAAFAGPPEDLLENFILFLELGVGYCDCIKTGGGQPRFITVSPWGTILAANETTDLVTEFTLDTETGAFKSTGWNLATESPVCLTFRT